MHCYSLASTPVPMFCWWHEGGVSLTLTVLPMSTMGQTLLWNRTWIFIIPVLKRGHVKISKCHNHCAGLFDFYINWRLCNSILKWMKFTFDSMRPLSHVFHFKCNFRKLLVPMWQASLVLSQTHPVDLWIFTTFFQLQTWVTNQLFTNNL